MAGPEVPEGNGGEQAGYRGDPSIVQKELSMRQGKADAMPVEMAKWERLKRRIGSLEKRWAINWLIAGASGSASVAVSALIAAVSLPSGEHSGIGSTVEPVLLVVAAAGVLLAGALVGFFFLEKHGRTDEGADIVDEMETDEAAWKQREAQADRTQALP